MKMRQCLSISRIILIAKLQSNKMFIGNVKFSALGGSAYSTPSQDKLQKQ